MQPANQREFFGHPAGLYVLFFVELWEFLRARKKFWLLPILLVMVLLGGLIVLAQGSAIAPFIYTLF